MLPVRAMIQRTATIAAAACLLCTPSVAAQQAVDTATVMESVERLKPGEFLWFPQAAPEGPLFLMVNLTTQRAVLYRNGVPIGISTVSTGRFGFSTPTGVFTILEKDPEHFSNVYDNAPMPYMQRLTWSGVALHAGQLPGYPASHGCIRLPLEFAKRLFAVTRLGMTVVVNRVETLPRIAPAPQMSPAQPGDPATAFEWAPERAPDGPVSIVVSGADRKVVVIRNGRVIGTAMVAFEEAIRGTQIYMLQSQAGDDRRWLRFDLTADARAEQVPASALRRFNVPPDFRQAVASIIGPGTTVVITADSLTQQRAVTLLEGE
ncbi:MAG: L,D-transpeptidase [Sphingomonas sp.]|uniref:L,D-transpeptidase n=1 Tax=Sphingomonas sp. TaxID=28214 RepID=UPI002274DAF2|nr:L,D-transpeptidase [Sphingomonas sp.]MCX8475481.1 L,D-transpeptidase [Sphingomonas sp.]